jgi:hypothetical protein
MINFSFVILSEIMLIGNKSLINHGIASNSMVKFEGESLEFNKEFSD